MFSCQAGGAHGDEWVCGSPAEDQEFRARRRGRCRWCGRSGQSSPCLASHCQKNPTLWCCHPIADTETIDTKFWFSFTSWHWDVTHPEIQQGAVVTEVFFFLSIMCNSLSFSSLRELIRTDANIFMVRNISTPGNKHIDCFQSKNFKPSFHKKRPPDSL